MKTQALLQSTIQPFGKTPTGKPVTLYTFILGQEISFSVMDYGATLTHLFVPDREGQLSDVVLGFDDLEGFFNPKYLQNYCYMGVTMGRTAGRFSGNQFQLDGTTYPLPPNQKGMHLHGGVEGWDRKIWEAVPFEEEDAIGVNFAYSSPDGEEGYPGNVRIRVTYTLNRNGQLSISYKGNTDQKTVLNPANHSYFNLSGDFTQSIGDHELEIQASAYLPIDENILPNGEVLPVADTLFDFREARKLQTIFHVDHPQLNFENGLDHTFELDQAGVNAVLYHPGSGRQLTVETNSPGLQIYTGNFLDKSFPGKGGILYDKWAAICLETQIHPDSTSHPHFPSMVLSPSEEFQSKTTFSFSTR